MLRRSFNLKLFNLICICVVLSHQFSKTESSNLFEDGAEDNLDDEERIAWSSSGSFLDKNKYQKSSRQDEFDVEVILNPGPMIAPDIIIRQFVDSKVNVDKMMEEAGYPAPVDSLKPGLLELPENSLSDEINFEQNEIPDIDRFFAAHKLDPLENNPESPKLKVFSGSQPCRMKLNGTSGSFSMNFTEDCVILITTPEKKSRIVLNCSPIVLGNCTTSRDTLTVNLKGDMKFGRNSYFYCGPNAQIRASSLRRRISIKIRRSHGIEESSQCTFHSRKRRDLNFEKQIGLFSYPVSSCGRLGRNSKIVGGRRVSPGLFPWVAQLDITRTDGTQTACTGSLVSPEYVLTAAHCLRNAESISVFMGGTDRHEFTGTEITVQAEKYILHRKWSPRTLTADIALVKLTDAVKYTNDVSPICLPGGKLSGEDFSGRKGVAVGWGRVDSKKKAPRQLYRVRLPFLSEQRCQRIYRRFFIPKIMVCTDSTTDAAICYGDSGGPLMYKRKDKVYQIGVSSFSLSKTCGASPDVFTHVREYVPWIQGRINPEEY